jgi:hypothetical protein
MFEFQKVITDFIGFLQLADLCRFLVPYAGVGGGVEAKESVDVIHLIKFTLLFLAGIGTIFGLGLAVTAKRFSVKIDPKIEQVKDALAHAH